MLGIFGGVGSSTRMHPGGKFLHHRAGGVSKGCWVVWAKLSAASCVRAAKNPPGKTCFQPTQFSKILGVRFPRACGARQIWTLLAPHLRPPPPTHPPCVAFPCLSTRATAEIAPEVEDDFVAMVYRIKKAPQVIFTKFEL